MQFSNVLLMIQKPLTNGLSMVKELKPKNQKNIPSHLIIHVRKNWLSKIVNSLMRVQLKFNLLAELRVKLLSKWWTVSLQLRYLLFRYDNFNHLLLLKLKLFLPGFLHFGKIFCPIWLYSKLFKISTRIL